MEKLQYYLDIATEKAIFFAPRIIISILIVWIGFKVIRHAIKLLDKTFKRMQISETMRPFLLSVVSIIAKGAILFVTITVLGADLSGLVAILAAISFAIGLSLQGSLGNFASGILILFLKPYQVNDWIEVGDKFGKVEEIGIFNTIVITPGSKVLIIPNAKITDDVVTNYSKKGIVRLEIKITMPYEEDFPKVKRIIQEALTPIKEITNTPETEIGIENFDSHSVQIVVRPYVHPDDYWQVTFDVYKNIKAMFSKHNIKVAYSEGIELGRIGA